MVILSLSATAYAAIFCFCLLTVSTTSEVKNDHAHVIKQDICNKFIEINFCGGCMVSQPNCLWKDLPTVSLINKMLDESPVESIHNKYNNQPLGILNNFILEFSKANCVMTPNRSSAAL